MSLTITRKVSVTGGTVLRAANNLGDVASVPTAQANLGLPALRNALAPRGGLAFDGTASTRVYSALTNQNIGTDAFSWVGFVRVPSSTGSVHPIMALTSSPTTVTQAASIQMDFGSDGKLRVYVYGATTNDYFGSTFASATYGVGAYAGKVIMLSIVRTVAGALELRINNGSDIWSARSADSGGTIPTAAQSITSTYLCLGFSSSGSVSSLVFYSSSLYNLGLAQADVTEIYELGGAVPERFKFGSQAELVTNGDFASGTGWTVTGAGASIGAGVASFAGVNTGATFYRSVAHTQGKAHRVRFTLSNFVAGSVTPFLGGLSTGGAYGTARSANGTHEEVMISAAFTGTAFLGLYATTTTTTADIDNVSVARVGAVVHYDADLDGIGNQLHDQSTNKLHSLLTTTGVSWSKAATMGYIKALSDGTTSAQALGGGTILPANCQIQRVRARSFSGTPSITLGTASGGSQVVASVALSTAWKDLTIALTGGINSSANSLWMTASAANVVEVQLAYEQLPA